MEIYYKNGYWVITYKNLQWLDLSLDICLLKALKTLTND